MRMNAKELIAEARVTTPTLPPAAAKLMTAMADRLDLQFVALCESRNEVKQLAAESYTNLQSAARELNTSWMMHKTMLGAQAALLCLSQGDIRGARDWLEGTTDEAFVEIPDDMTPSGLQAWFDSNMTSNDGHNGFLTQEEALERLRQRAPATDAYAASLRAEGVEVLRQHPAIQLCSLTHVCDEVVAQLRSQSAASPAPLSAAITDIIAERHRQQSAEGWTQEHDDTHDKAEMVLAAISYLMAVVNPNASQGWWPWDIRSWKPSSGRRDLVKAGALIAAEIERIDRQAAQVKGVQL